LAPIPFRGKRNESSYIVKVIEKLASLYGLSSEEIVLKTTENSKAIFGI
jgi:TatD DNase family protein